MSVDDLFCKYKKQIFTNKILFARLLRVYTFPLCLRYLVLSFY